MGFEFTNKGRSLCRILKPRPRQRSKHVLGNSSFYRQTWWYVLVINTRVWCVSESAKSWKQPKQKPQKNGKKIRIALTVCWYLRAKASMSPPEVSSACAPPNVSHVSRLGMGSCLPRTNVPWFRSWFSGFHCLWILLVNSRVDLLVSNRSLSCSSFRT